MTTKRLKIHYGELSTKGKNRRMFQQKLAEQIRYKTKSLEKIKIIANFDFMYLEWETTPYESIIEIIKTIPGIARFEPVYQVEKNLGAIQSRAVELFNELSIEPGDSFKVVAKRSDKNFVYDTYDIQREVGHVIGETFPQLKVEMRQPTYRLAVQIDQGNHAYLSLVTYLGLQGMPYGSSGRGLLMLSGGFDSPVAGYLMMKRGLEIEAVHFSSPPYTSPQALDKAKRLASTLAHYGMPIQFINIPFAKIQESIKAHVHDQALMTVMRRMMLRIMDRLIVLRKADAIVNGESLGQVASQTIQSMRVINEVTHTPILRPLIAYDKNDIIDIAQNIGTHDISNEPFEDCCTVFAPASPHTKPRIEKIEELESRLPIEALVEEAINNLTIEVIDEHYQARKIEQYDQFL